ncbi:basic leucine zipper 61-like [Lotus japonicus]|uniref:basic leucine zipper 61-like n=1 Tax=Lotus japonicus TaxID=34305 RepID=UPI002584B85E|nr:basic leucine zipper 61-like [Lotus japonicus]
MAQLPPKIPNMPPTWSDFSSNQKNIIPSLKNMTPNAATQRHHHHHGQSPSWVDEFLDFSSSRRGAHRRSVSDPVTFVEMMPPAMLEHCHRKVGSGGGEFDRFDDEQFLSMFSDEVSGNPVMPPPPTVSCSDPSTPSDHNSINDEKEMKGEKEVEQEKEEQQQQLKQESDEDESQIQCKQEAAGATNEDNNNNNDSNAATLSSDRITDPKRVKRILANRQSAQRSRVRKLQYISELERSVTSLQAEVSVLSPRVAFLDHQRLLLNVDNSALKQRIAALAQDKIFKDAHQEALKREIDRLRQVYHQQNMKKMDSATGSQSPSPSPKPRCDTHTEKEHLINA